MKMYCILSVLVPILLFSQENRSTGGNFIKRMEFNVLSIRYDSTGKIVKKWNLEGKSKDEILLFGENNGYVEFYTLPSFEGIYGFRVIKIENRYVMEIRQISDSVSISLPVSSDFARLLHDRYRYLICNFKGVSSRKIINGTIWENVILDGDTRIFRCIVDDEVWMLKIHEPDREIRDLSNICNKIFKDAKSGMFSKEKYMKDLRLLSY